MQLLVLSIRTRYQSHLCVTHSSSRSLISKDPMKMSVCTHENRKSCLSSASMNIFLFHKSSYADSVLTHLNALRQQQLFTDVLLHAGRRSFPCHRAVLAACSRYFQVKTLGLFNIAADFADDC